MKNRHSSAPYSTHITPLVTAIVNTDGPVLEMGCGDFSTPILHALCKNRKLITAEHNKDWLDLFIDLESDRHIFKHVKSWDDIAGNFDVVFIDHAPASRRIIDIERLRKTTKIFVIHDTEKEKFYKYEPLLSSFKFRYDYDRYIKKTTIVSDIINIQKFFED